jgi:hypothetical protein
VSLRGQRGRRGEGGITGGRGETGQRVSAASLCLSSHRRSEGGS